MLSIPRMPSLALAALALTVSPAFAQLALSSGLPTTGTYDYSAEAGAGSIYQKPNDLFQAYPQGSAFMLSRGLAGQSTATSSSLDGPNTLVISATATAVPMAGDRSFATGETDIQFSITATGTTGTVPVDVTAILKSQGQTDPANSFGVVGSAVAEASLYINAGGGDLAPANYTFFSCLTSSCLSAAVSENDVNTTINLLAGRTYSVTESVYVSASVLEAAPGVLTLSASASADPTFIINQNFLNLPGNSGATLIFSNSAGPGGGAGGGVGIPAGAGGAPEPSTWALMMIGVGGMGGALRKRRRPAMAA